MTQVLELAAFTVHAGHEQALSSACGVAMFANEGGAYDELIAYFRQHPNEF